MERKNAVGSLRLLGFMVVTLFFTTPAFSQGTERILKWPEPVINHATMISTTSQGLAQVDALEIIDISVGGKPITLGRSFPADDDWLKTLTFKVKNISNRTITSLQINLFLPQIMPGGPQVPVCYGCGDTYGKVIHAGEVVEVKTVFYNWVVEAIKNKTTLSKINVAEIHDIVVKLPDGTTWLSGCMKAADAKNGCPTP